MEIVLFFLCIKYAHTLVYVTKELISLH